MLRFRRSSPTGSQHSRVSYPSVDSVDSGAPSPLPLMAGVSFCDCSHSGGCVVLSPCGFNLHFWRTSEVEHFFHVLIGPSGMCTFDSSNLLPIFS